jgi:hypothetical protein
MIDWLVGFEQNLLAGRCWTASTTSSQEITFPQTFEPGRKLF